MFNRITCIIILLLTSCTSFREKYVDTYAMSGQKRINFKKRTNSKRMKLIEQCAKNWKYLELTESISVEIIQYTKAYNVDLFWYPAVLICKTNEGDTVRVLIRNLKSELKAHENIVVVPDTAVNINDPLQIGLIVRDKPLFLAKNKNEDKYFCEVKRTYFAKQASN